MEKNNSLGIIGAGSCGNQQALLAGKENMPVLAINSASIDLDDIMNDPEAQDYCTVIKIGDTEGCGKNRKLAKKLLKQDVKEVLEATEIVFGKEEIKTVIVTGSTNSGTGSGLIALLADILRSVYPDMTIITMPILPCDKTPRSLANSIECMKEIIELNIPYIPIDNSKCKGKSIKEIYDRVNQDILYNFKIINGDFIRPSSYGNMDEQDRKRLFSTPGMMRISKVSGLKNNLEESIGSLIVDSIKQNFGADLKGDKVIKRMGVIYTVTEEMLQKIDNTYEEVIDYIGTPIEIFEHINIVEDEKECSIITILAGLSAPDDRLEEMSQIVMRAQNDVSKFNESKVSEYNKSLAWLNDLDDDDDDLGIKVEEKPKADIDNIVNKYF